MNNDKITTRSKAIIWWTEQVRNGKAQLYRDKYSSGAMLIDNNEIEMVYLSEHPTETESKKEEGKEQIFH